MYLITPQSKPTDASKSASKIRDIYGPDIEATEFDMLRSCPESIQISLLRTRELRCLSLHDCWAGWLRETREISRPWTPPRHHHKRKELAMTSSKPVRLLTPDEAAQFLSVSQRTVKRLVAEGSLRAYKVRRSMRFRLEDLEAYVEQNNWT